MGTPVQEEATKLSSRANASNPSKPLAGHKTALVLAGGGVAGIAYELGALYAIEKSLSNMRVTDFDIYVGTSAGATVAALLANGFTPGTILQAVEGKHDKTRPFLRQDLWRFNMGHLVRAGLRIPGQLWRAGQSYLRDVRDTSFFGTLWVLMDLLPPAFYDSSVLETYLQELIQNLGGSNEFSALTKELNIVATRLDNGERAVFDRQTNVQISEAITASSAVPGLYKPVRLNNVDYIDGGVRGNASIDLAVERGATTIVCINPIVPYDTLSSADQEAPDIAKDAETEVPTLQSVLTQVLRTRIHAGLHYHIKHMQTSYPDVDFYLIEPEKSDEMMSAPNLMRYEGRMEIAQRAFESVTWQLMQAQAEWGTMWQQQGVNVRPGLNRAQCIRVLAAADQPAMLHHLLHRSWPPPSGERLHRNGKIVTDELEQVLTRLDKSLDKTTKKTPSTA